MSSKKLSHDEGIGKSKVKRVPDFDKLHQQWSSRLEQRKALSKKPCTVPMEFDVHHEKVTFGRAITTPKSSASKTGKSTAGKVQRPTSKSPCPNVKFKANNDALASILNEEGIRNEVTPPKSYSMYFRAGDHKPENVFKTPQLPKSTKKPVNKLHATASALNKETGHVAEPEDKFEVNSDALRGIMNEEGIKKDVATPRHFSMYCRTGQPPTTTIAPNNILMSAKKEKDTLSAREKDSSKPDVDFEASNDALMSILNEKGISNEVSTPKYHSMYCRTGQPLRTPQQSQSVRKSIYYQAATSNSQYTAQMYSRQTNVENNYFKREKLASHKALIKTLVAVPIRNSIYKNYCFSPVVKVTPNRNVERNVVAATAPKTASRIRWADVLCEDEASKVKVNDNFPVKLSFDDLDSPHSDKENMPVVASKSRAEVKTKLKVSTQEPTVQKFCVFHDKDFKQSPSEIPKSSVLRPLSPNVYTPPRSPRKKDILHHNSPLKAVIGNKPRYYCPASPRLEHQVSTATDLINKENRSPLRPTTKDKDFHQTEKLKDDVMDLSMTLNQSILMYDQLQVEADQLLTTTANDEIILMKLEKIKAKQQKLVKMEEFLKRKLKRTISADPKPESDQSNKVEKTSGDIESPLVVQAVNKPSEATSITSRNEDADHIRCTIETQEDETKQQPEMQAITSNTGTERYTQNELSVKESYRVPVAVVNAKSKDDAVQSSGVHRNGGAVFASSSSVPQKELTPQIRPKPILPEETTRIPEESKHLPHCSTPPTNKVTSTPVPKRGNVAENLVMPTPTRTGPGSPTKTAIYFPAICTPLSMKDLANQPESRRDSLGRSPDTPEDIRDSYSIDKSVASSVNCDSPMSGISLPRMVNYHDSLGASPSSCGSPNRTQSPLALFPGTPVQLYMGTPGSPVTLRGSLSLSGNINFAKHNTPGRAAGLLLPAAVHRYHDALLDDEVSLYMCRLKRYGSSIYTADARIQDPVAEVLTIGDEMHFIPVSGDDLLLGFSFQPLEGSAFSILKTKS